MKKTEKTFLILFTFVAIAMQMYGTYKFIHYIDAKIFTSVMLIFISTCFIYLGIKNIREIWKA